VILRPWENTYPMANEIGLRSFGYLAPIWLSIPEVCGAEDFMIEKPILIPWYGRDNPEHCQRRPPEDGAIP
jgi:hypothetical protein